MERKMKDSGIPWIGQIPVEWNISQLKRALTICNGLDYKHVVAEDGYPVMGSGGVFAYASQYLYEGEVVLLGRKGTIDKPQYFSGRFWTVDTMFYGIPSKQSHCKFLFYLAQTIPFKYYSTSTSIPSMTSSDLGNHFLAFPPLEEQERITAYLDEKCGEIDELIGIEEQMITDLEAYRQAVITEAVTHGLNPQVPQKESEVAWIVNMPSHWEEIRLKFLANISTGDKDTIMANADGNYPFFVRSPKIERIDTYSYDGEAILMAGDGVGAGRVFHHFVGKFDWHQRVYNLHELKDEICGRFLYYFLLSNFYKLIDAGSAKSTVDSVRLPMITNFIILVPPIDEQKVIAEYLDAKCAEIDDLIRVKQEKIETLKQYRQSLIFEAVTGKIEIA